MIQTYKLIVEKLQKIFKFYRIGSITNPFLCFSKNANNEKQKYVYNFKGNEKYSESFLSDHHLYCVLTLVTTTTLKRFHFVSVFYFVNNLQFYKGYWKKRCIPKIYCIQKLFSNWKTKLALQPDNFSRKTNIVFVMEKPRHCHLTNIFILYFLALKHNKFWLTIKRYPWKFAYNTVFLEVINSD